MPSSLESIPETVGQIILSSSSSTRGAFPKFATFHVFDEEIFENFSVTNNKLLTSSKPISVSSLFGLFCFKRFALMRKNGLMKKPFSFCEFFVYISLKFIKQTTHNNIFNPTNVCVSLIERLFFANKKFSLRYYVRNEEFNFGTNLTKVYFFLTLEFYSAERYRRGRVLCVKMIWDDAKVFFSFRSRRPRTGVG